jgi:hypothetical protein
MSIRKRTWKTAKGDAKEAWVVDYVDQAGKRRLKLSAPPCRLCGGPCHVHAFGYPLPTKILRAEVCSSQQFSFWSLLALMSSREQLDCGDHECDRDSPSPLDIVAGRL